MDFESTRFQLGVPDVTKVEALGQPGQRRFRLLLQTPDIAATLWLEKEQLAQLAVLLTQFAQEMGSAREAREVIPEGRIPRADRFLDFTVGRIAVGRDEARAAVVVVVHNIEDDEDAPPMVSFWLTRPKADQLGRDAVEVVRAGRPRCPLCGGPVDPTGHVCARMNGHKKSEAPT